MFRAMSTIAAYGMTVAAITFLCCVLAFALGGCASPKQWQKKGAMPVDLDRAKLECEYEAAKAEMPSRGLVGAAAEGVRQAQLQVMCLRVKGYELS